MKFSSARTRTAILLVLNIAIFYFIGKWLYENARPALVLSQIRDLSVVTILQVVGANMLVVAAYGKRMALLLRGDFLTSWYTVNLGFGMNGVLPFRLGEPAKIYYAFRYLGLSPVRVATATFVEKYLDLISIAALLGLMLASSANRILGPSLLWWTIAVLVAASLVILSFNKGLTALEKVATGSSRLKTLISDAKAATRGYSLRPLLIATGIIWVFNVLVVYFAFNAFLPAVKVSPADALTLLVICALAVAVPAAPAGLGLFEAGIVAYLTQVLKVSQEQALVVAVVFHLAVILPQILIMLALIAKRTYAKPLQPLDTQSGADPAASAVGRGNTKRGERVVK